MRQQLTLNHHLLTGMTFMIPWIALILKQQPCQEILPALTAAAAAAAAALAASAVAACRGLHLALKLLLSCRQQQVASTAQIPDTMTKTTIMTLLELSSI
jgi:hypothetical protein